MPFTNDAPPSGAKNTSRGKASSPRIPAGHKARQEALEGLGQLVQIPLIATKQHADAAALGQHWPGVAKELANLADTNTQLANLIDPLIQVGPYTGLIIAVLPLVLQVMVNHGVTQPGIMGTVPKNALAAQMEASLAQAEMMAMQQQAAAEEAARQMRAETDKARQEMVNAQASQAATVVTD